MSLNAVEKRCEQGQDDEGGDEDGANEVALHDLGC